MADQQTTFRLKFDNEDMNRVFEQLIERVEQTEGALRDLEKTQGDVAKATATAGQEANEQLRDQAKNLDTAKVKFKDLKNEAGQALEDIAGKGGEAAGTLARLARAAGPVGIAIAAVGTAVAVAFLSVKSNARAAQRELAALKAVGNELKERVFAGIRSAVFSALGPSGAVLAALEARRAFGDLRKELDGVAASARAAFDLAETVATSARILRRVEAERGAQIERNRALSADERRSTAERIGLIRQAAGEEKRLNEDRVFQLEAEVNLLKAQNSEWEQTPEILEDIADKEAQINELRGANAVIQIQTQQEVNALLKAEAEARARIVEQIKDAGALLEGQQAERAIQRQIDAFRELGAAVRAAGLGDQFAAELAGLEEVSASLEQRLKDGLIEPLKELPATLRESLSVIDDFGNEVVKSVTSQTDSFEAELVAEGARIAKLLNKGIQDETESLTDDQKEFLIQSFTDTFNSVASIIISGTEAAIRRQDALVSAREDSIRELERQLNEEERLQSQGFANSSNALRDRLTKETELLRKEQEKRLELEKRAARQRLIADSIQQASQITLATAKLLAEGAGGFIPGLIAAAGAVALLFRIIAQAKANAVQFAAPPKFRTGTEFVDGPGTGTSDSVAAYLSRGERVLPADLNEELGGRRLTNEELVEYVRIGQRLAEDPALGATAEDAITPMAAAIAGGAAAQAKIEAEESAARDATLERVFAAEMRAMKEHITAELAARPIDTPLDRPIVREYRKGRTKVKEVIRPK